MQKESLDEGREVLRNADALLITAGAGMGVDSGLPDFRGDDGFWKAYPPYRKLGVSFVEMANPEHFGRDPHFGWGFYGHRLDLYRRTEPHAGYRMLREFAEGVPGGYFVFTSNVDGHFEKAVPTVRIASESLAGGFGNGTLIRVNPREAEAPDGISIEAGALEAIEVLGLKSF